MIIVMIFNSKKSIFFKEQDAQSTVLVPIGFKTTLSQVPMFGDICFSLCSWNQLKKAKKESVILLSKKIYDQ